MQLPLTTSTRRFLAVTLVQSAGLIVLVVATAIVVSETGVFDLPGHSTWVAVISALLVSANSARRRQRRQNAAA